MAGTVIVGALPGERRSNLEENLRAWGYEPWLCETPARLVATGCEHPTELVLLQHAEGQFEALQVAARLRASCPGRPPLLLLGVGSQPEERREALDHDVDLWLAEPVDLLELQAGLEALRRRQRARSDESLELRSRLEETRWTAQMAEEETIRRLAMVAEYRDHQESPDHVTRVGRLCQLLAQGRDLSPVQLRQIGLASALHDVGKVAVPDAILLKPGALSDAERAVMQQHTILGARLLSGSSSEMLRMAERVALTHHERWDGSGYPYALAATDIPFEGRLCALADVLEALTSNRPYRPAHSLEQARQIIRDSRGSHFDPGLVDALETNWEQAVAILRSSDPR